MESGFTSQLTVGTCASDPELQHTLADKAADDHNSPPTTAAH